MDILIKYVIHLINIHNLFQDVNKWFNNPTFPQVLICKLIPFWVFGIGCSKIDNIDVYASIIKSFVFQILRVLYFVLSHELLQTTSHR